MTIELEYDPRPQQIEIHRSLKRFNVLVCHRRFGKTVLCINQLIAAALRCDKERPRFGYVAPLYRQSKQVAWDYLKHYCKPIPGTTFNESELRVDLPNGARIQLYGADNPDSLRGIYLDGVVLDEYAQMSPKAWAEVIRPALSDRKGWAVFIGTPMGHNAFYDLYKTAQEDPDWFTGLYKASETKIIDQAELMAAKRHMTDDIFNQEYECSFEAAIRGAVFGKEMKAVQDQKRICAVPFDPDLLVHTAWDLGRSDSTVVIFFQTVGKEIRLIDVEEHMHAKPEFFATLLEQKGYTYGTHYLPHDAAARRFETGGVSIEEMFNNLGIVGTEVVDRPKVKEVSIQKTRSLFSRLWIGNQNERLKHLVECLLQYRYILDEDRNIFSNEPDHDWTSHVCDALQTLAMGYDDPIVDFRPVIQDFSGGRLAA